MQNPQGFNFNQDFLVNSGRKANIAPVNPITGPTMGFNNDFAAMPANNFNQPNMNDPMGRNVGNQAGFGQDFATPQPNMEVGGSPDGGSNWGFQDFATGLQLATGLYGAYLGNEQLGLAKEQFSFQKDFANQDYQNQSQDYNRQLRERYQGILANASPERRKQMASVDDYMNDNSVDEKV